MAKNKNDYFKLIEEQIGFCVQASELLEEILTVATEATMQTYKQQMHEIEHKADDIHHEILHDLSSEFITPIDQEDILHLVQIIDDVTDALDDVVMKLYMFGLDKIPPAAPAFSGKVKECIRACLRPARNSRISKSPQNCASTSSASTPAKAKPTICMWRPSTPCLPPRRSARC